ncbi:MULTISPECIES: hypothetical protein [Acetobacteraceae]|uniref:Uncharacterized protein n=1 Tax=Parasaccharibacter apium TaxID=1510841 RepID=A0A7U7J013_9PROT|nr:MULTISPECIES: hypothetical protein [Acetobacteraceae]MCQ0041522.1 hypothetical protein [Bombella sp.]MCT6820381.1 hypothetical protein [Bombella apis]MCT6846053.1 hypothetical protein [Bombella apis]CDG32706.1 hypothetical protein SACS_1845 [Parasaccharibacter apium]
MAPAPPPAGLLAGLALCLLAGCNQPPFRPLCPALVHYSPEEERAVARELHLHPDLKETPLFLLDYGNERHEIQKICS